LVRGGGAIAARRRRLRDPGHRAAALPPPGQPAARCRRTWHRWGGVRSAIWGLSVFSSPTSRDARLGSPGETVRRVGLARVACFPRPAGGRRSARRGAATAAAAS